MAPLGADRGSADAQQLTQPVYRVPGTAVAPATQTPPSATTTPATRPPAVGQPGAQPFAAQPPAMAQPPAVARPTTRQPFAAQPMAQPPAVRQAGGVMQLAQQGGGSRGGLFGSRVVRASAPADPTDPFAGTTPEQAGLSLFDTNVRQASAAEPPPFDLTQQPGEHPLAAWVRVAQAALTSIDQNVADYSATFTKVERLNGALADPQQMKIRVRHRPFSVYMKFVQPNPGQEVLYVENQNDNKLVALASGWKRRIGKLNLDPNGATAMRGQRHPITKAGIRNLTVELLKTAQSDVRFAECDVTHRHDVTIDGRPVSMIEATHPVPRKNFKWHKSRIFVDHQLRVPIAFEAYSWPTTTGGAPVLEERYIYTDLQLNNGFTDADFDPENPAIFN